MNILSKREFPELVLSLALAFVVVWFGINEVGTPSNWIGLVPDFFGGGELAVALVVTHGIVLILCGLSLITGLFTLISSIVLSLMLAQIVLGFIIKAGLSDVAVRDIGLLGASVSIALMSWKRSKI